MVKRAEITLLVLGIVMAVLALLALLIGNITALIIQGIISLLTFLLGYKAARDGNRGGARTLSLVMGWIFAGLLIAQIVLVVATTGMLSVWFLLIWGLSWLIVWGYFRAARFLAAG